MKKKRQKAGKYREVVVEVMEAVMGGYGEEVMEKVVGEMEEEPFRLRLGKKEQRSLQDPKQDSGSS